MSNQNFPNQACHTPLKILVRPENFLPSQGGFVRLYSLCLGAAFFVIRGKSNLQCRQLYSHPMDKSTGLKCDQTVVLTGFYAAKNYPDKLRRIKYHDEQTGKTSISNQQFFLVGVSHYRTLPLSLAGGVVLQMDQTTPAYQIVFQHHRERCKNTNMDCCCGLTCWLRSSRSGSIWMPASTQFYRF